jgi:hypothetical protein
VVLGARVGERNRRAPWHTMTLAPATLRGAASCVVVPGQSRGSAGPQRVQLLLPCYPVTHAAGPVVRIACELPCGSQARPVSAAHLYSCAHSVDAQSCR